MLKPLNRYIVYNNYTDFPVAIDATAAECAAAMGIKLRSFYRAYTRFKTGVGEKWYIEKSEEET